MLKPNPMISSVLCALVLLSAACRDRNERTKPKVATVTESVYASAVVKAEGQYQVYSTVTGILNNILVKAGARVKAGDLLIQLDNRIAGLNSRSASISLEQSRENLRRNSDRLEEAGIAVQAARDKYRLDSALYVRQKKLWDQRIGTQVEFEQRRLMYETSQKALLSSQKKLGQLRTQLKNEYRNAGIGYDLSKERQADYQIRSKISGIVYDILPEPGELITPQTPLAVIGKDRFFLEMQVDEEDIARIRTGQAVEILFDTYKGRTFRGKVQQVYRIMDPRSSTFQVDAELLNPPPKLYPNQQAEVNIIIQTRKDAIVIPREYLDSQGRIWLSRSERKAVRTGLQDDEKVEILDDLDTSRFIYKPTE
ncbi:MAG TPA: efflux RND transporter periplasmic adaptor subunit [Sphingobacteriaceae bacterium]